MQEIEVERITHSREVLYLIIIYDSHLNDD